MGEAKADQLQFLASFFHFLIVLENFHSLCIIPFLCKFPLETYRTVVGEGTSGERPSNKGCSRSWITQGTIGTETYHGERILSKKGVTSAKMTLFY